MTTEPLSPPRYATNSLAWWFHDAVVHPVTGTLGLLGRLCRSPRVMALGHHIHNSTAPSNDAVADYIEAARRAGHNETAADPYGSRTPDQNRVYWTPHRLAEQELQRAEWYLEERIKGETQLVDSYYMRRSIAEAEDRVHRAKERLAEFTSDPTLPLQIRVQEAKLDLLSYRDGKLGGSGYGRDREHYQQAVITAEENLAKGSLGENQTKEVLAEVMAREKLAAAEEALAAFEAKPATEHMGCSLHDVRRHMNWPDSPLMAKIRAEHEALKAAVEEARKRENEPVVSLGEFLKFGQAQREETKRGLGDDAAKEPAGARGEGQ